MNDMLAVQTLHNIESIALERVRGHSAQGITSTFSFGANYGFWLAVVNLYNCEVKYPTPGQWQDEILGIKDEDGRKIQSIKRCNDELGIGLKHEEYGKDSGKADAFNLACYAKRFKGQILPECDTPFKKQKRRSSKVRGVKKSSV